MTLGMVASASARPPPPDLPARLLQLLRTRDLRIPPYPAVAAALSRIAADGRAKSAEVTAVVATDAALAATVLRHAATAGRTSGAPPTLEAAVWKLGFDELMRIVLASTVGAAAAAPGPLSGLRRDYWRRSLLAALFCRELAPRRGVPIDQAFLAGLLHDFGAVVALAAIEALDGGPLPVLPAAEWTRMVDDVHIELGMVVAARWQLPEPISEAITSHHTPQSAMRIHRPLVQLVAVVDQAIHSLDSRAATGLASLADVPGLDPDERARIGALVPQVAEQMARFESEVVREAPSAIAPVAIALQGGWPVDFPIVGRRDARYRACALSPELVAFRGAAAQQPGWLTELDLGPPAVAFRVLAHVLACTPLAEGGFVLVARPFGLGGEAKIAWLELLARTRPLSADERAR